MKNLDRWFWLILTPLYSQEVTVLEEDKEAPCIEENNDATSGVDFWRKRWSNLAWRKL